MAKKSFFDTGLAFFLITTLIVLSDQLFKSIVAKQLAHGESVVVIPKILYLTLAHNTGMAFGMMSGLYSLSIWVSLIVVGLVIYFYDSVKSIRARIALALILGGTIGNFIDRVAYGYVIDYINVRVWPIFNLADMALTIGVLLMIIEYWRSGYDQNSSTLSKARK